MTAAALGAVVGAAAGIAYDVSATHFGLLDPPARVRGERRGAWATVLSYGPAYFGGMGAVCGVALWAAARRFAGGADGLAVWLAAASAVGALPFVAGVLVLAWRQRTTRVARTAATPFRSPGLPRWGEETPAPDPGFPAPNAPSMTAPSPGP